MRHPNIAVVERFFSSFAARDQEGLQAVLAKDVRWIIPGRHPHAGVKTGFQQVMGYFAVLEKAGLQVEPMFLEANDACVVDVHHIRSTTGPVRLEGLSVLLWRIEQGQIVEARNFPGDQALWDRFFETL